MHSEQEQIATSKKAGIDWITRAAESVSQPWNLIRSLGKTVRYHIDDKSGVLSLKSNDSKSGLQIPLSIHVPKWPYLLKKLGYGAFSLSYGRRDWTASNLNETTNALATFIATKKNDSGLASTLIKQPSLRSLSKSIQVKPLLGSKEELVGRNLWSRELESMEWGTAPEALAEIAVRLKFRDYDHVLDTSSIPCDGGTLIAKQFHCSMTLVKQPTIFQAAIRERIRDLSLQSNIILSKHGLSEMKGSFTKIIGLYPYAMHSQSQYKSYLKNLTARATKGTMLGLSVLAIGSHHASKKSEIYDLMNIADLRFPTITGVAANLESLGWNVSRIEEISNFDPLLSPLNPKARSEPRHVLRRRNDFNSNCLKSLNTAGLISSFVVTASK